MKLTIIMKRIKFAATYLPSLFLMLKLGGFLFVDSLATKIYIYINKTRHGIPSGTAPGRVVVFYLFKTTLASKIIYNNTFLYLLHQTKLVKCQILEKLQ